MAITAIGNLCTANDKDPTAVDCVATPVRSVAVGAVLVAWVAYDSVFDVFNPSQSDNSYKVYDSAGNIWTNIGARVDTQGFFGLGAWAGLFITQCRAALSTSDTITLHSGAAGSLVAKAISVEEFDIGAGMVWCAQGPYNRAGAVAADPPGTSFSIFHTEEWLELHCLATEGPDTDTYTWDSNWTQIAGTGTTGGADDTNIHVRGGYRIAVEDVLAVDVASTIDRDNSQCFNAVCAIPASKAFPTTPLYDDFNRADEFPLDGGLWDIFRAAFGSAPGSLVSNHMEGGGGSFIAAADWLDCGEVYSTITDWNSPGYSCMLHIFARGASHTVTMQGIGVEFTHNPTVGDHVIFGDSSNDGSVERGKCTIWIDGFDGIKWGIQVNRGNKDGGNTADILASLAVRAWFDLGSGWEEVAAWYTHPTNPKNGVPAICARVGSFPKQDDFGCGEIKCDRPTFRPQIYRRQFGVA